MIFWIISLITGVSVILYSYTEDNENPEDNEDAVDTEVVLPSLTIDSFDVPPDVASIEDILLGDGTLINITVLPWDENNLTDTGGPITFIATFPVGTTLVELKTSPTRSYLTNVSLVPTSKQTTAQLIMNYLYQGEGVPTEITSINLHLNGSNNVSASLKILRTS
jgi:hypothetical protein